MMKSAITALMLLAGASFPAFAQDTPPQISEELKHQLESAIADFDPFAPLKLEKDEMLPPLKCMPRAKFEAAIKAHEGSEIVQMTPLQAMFYRGLYAGLPIAPPGYPIGDGVVYAVKMIDAPDNKTSLGGTVAFTLGEFIVCNVMPIGPDMLNMLFKAGGALAKDSR